MGPQLPVEFGSLCNIAISFAIAGIRNVAKSMLQKIDQASKDILCMSEMKTTVDEINECILMGTLVSPRGSMNNDGRRIQTMKSD